MHQKLKLGVHVPARILRHDTLTRSYCISIAGFVSCTTARSPRPDLCPLRTGDVLHPPALGATRSWNQGAHVELSDRKGDIPRRINTPAIVCKVMYTSMISIPSPHVRMITSHACGVVRQELKSLPVSRLGPRRAEAL